MSVPQLVEATNQLFRLDARDTEVDAEDIVQGLTLACRALESTLNDWALARSLDVLSAQSPPSWTNGALERFCRTFIGIEREILHTAGLSDGAIRSLMDVAEETLEACVSAPLNVGQLYVSLHLLENRLCSRAQHLRKIARDRRSRVNTRSTIQRGVTGLGGTAIVALNAGATGNPTAISTPMALVSISIGSSLISAAIGAPWDNKRNSGH